MDLAHLLGKFHMKATEIVAVEIDMTVIAMMEIEMTDIEMAENHLAATTEPTVVPGVHLAATPQKRSQPIPAPSQLQRNQRVRNQHFHIHYQAPR
jgi:hypothetical protein